MIKIAPSILSANFATLGAEVAAVCAAGADYIHVDVMDGQFVPNLTIGPLAVAAIKPYANCPLDVHLMIERPEQMVEAFAHAGANIITIHAEATNHLDRTLQRIRALGVKAGVSLCPSTPESALEYVLGSLDLVLIMTVNPGFGGQQFLPSQLEKIRRVKAMIQASGRSIELEVDGGINPKTAADVVAAGANVLVAGSAVFKGNPADYSASIAALKAA